MAQCYQCRKGVSYFSFWKGCFKNLRRNFWRSRQLPISNCPHCGVECQETALTAFGFLILVVGIIFGFMKTIEFFDIELENDLGVILGIVIFVFVFGNLWWRFVSKLKEPSSFG